MKAYYKGKRAHLRLTCVVQKSFRITSLMLFNWGYVQTIRDGMNSNGPELEQVVHTHRISSWSAGPKGFGKLNPEHLLLSLLLAPNKFASARSDQSVAQNLSDMWHSSCRDRHGAASLLYRNRAAKTVLTCEQKPHKVWFPCCQKSPSNIAWT